MKWTICDCPLNEEYYYSRPSSGGFFMPVPELVSIRNFKFQLDKGHIVIYEPDKDD